MKFSDFVDKKELKMRIVPREIQSALAPVKPRTSNLKKPQKISLEQAEELLEEIVLRRRIEKDYNDQKQALVVSQFMGKIKDVSILTRKLQSYGWKSKLRFYF